MYFQAEPSVQEGCQKSCSACEIWPAWNAVAGRACIMDVVLLSCLPSAYLRFWNDTEQALESGLVQICSISFHAAFFMVETYNPPGLGGLQFPSSLTIGRGI